MTMFKSVLMESTLVLWASVAGAQVDPITTTRLTDQLYLFSTDQGAYTTNSLAFVGEENLLAEWEGYAGSIEPPSSHIPGPPQTFASAAAPNLP